MVEITDHGGDFHGQTLHPRSLPRSLLGKGEWGKSPGGFSQLEKLKGKRKVK